MEAGTVVRHLLGRDRPKPGEGQAATELDEPIDGAIDCAACGRFPLIGERVIRHETRGGRSWVCTVCEINGRGDRLGPVIGSQRIRSLGGSRNVHRAA